jgi:predicted metal-binding membrane protein
MNRIQIILVSALISISVITWLVSSQQYDTMMSAMMMFHNPAALLLFTVIWTAGMAAMMFPAISPMVLLYDRIIKNKSNNEASSSKKGEANESLLVGIDNSKEQEKMKSSVSFWSPYSLKMILFVGSYLLVWAITGIAILVGWSIPMNYLLTEPFTNNAQSLVDIIFGVLLVISGLYQFSPLKTKCLGYCESPMSFFMRRWRSGTVGAMKMGMYHGLYCLGCCWPYFLLMVALGWMNLLWMALFAVIIFGEKVWVGGGKWIARSTGVGFVVLGTLALLGIMEVPTGDMTIADVVGNNDKGTEMEMSDGMNMEMKMNMDNENNGMQTNMDMDMNDSMAMK